MEVEIVAAILWITYDLWMVLDATNTYEDMPRRIDERP